MSNLLSYALIVVSFAASMPSRAFALDGLTCDQEIQSDILTNAKLLKPQNAILLEIRRRVRRRLALSANMLFRWDQCLGKTDPTCLADIEKVRADIFPAYRHMQVALFLSQPGLYQDDDVISALVRKVDHPDAALLATLGKFRNIDHLYRGYKMHGFKLKPKLVMPAPLDDEQLAEAWAMLAQRFESQIRTPFMLSPAGNLHQKVDDLVFHNKPSTDPKVQQVAKLVKFGMRDERTYLVQSYRREILMTHPAGAFPTAPGEDQNHFVDQFVSLYGRIIQSHRLLGLLPSSRPSDNELGYAFKTVEKNNAYMVREVTGQNLNDLLTKPEMSNADVLAKEGVSKLKDNLKFAEVVDEVAQLVSGQPELADALKQLKSSYDWHQTLWSNAQEAALFAAGFACTAATDGLGSLGCFAIVGLPMNLLFLGQSVINLDNEIKTMFSSPCYQLALTKIERIKQSDRDVWTSLALVPFGSEMGRLTHLRRLPIREIPALVARLKMQSQGYATNTVVSWASNSN